MKFKTIKPDPVMVEILRQIVQQNARIIETICSPQIAIEEENGLETNPKIIPRRHPD